jgi:hypothetical protein
MTLVTATVLRTNQGTTSDGTNSRSSEAWYQKVSSYPLTSRNFQLLAPAIFLASTASILTVCQPRASLLPGSYVRLSVARS